MIDSHVVELLVTRRVRLAASPLGSLSPRELEVMQQMVQGRTSGAIAEALVLSESAIERRVSAIDAGPTFRGVSARGSGLARAGSATRVRIRRHYG
jgi:FixJ family two-component response regulator